eukprot:5838931-Amphidinium_carterae.1
MDVWGTRFGNGLVLEVSPEMRSNIRPLLRELVVNSMETWIRHHQEKTWHWIADTCGHSCTWHSHCVARNAVETRRLVARSKLTSLHRGFLAERIFCEVQECLENINVPYMFKLLGPEAYFKLVVRLNFSLKVIPAVSLRSVVISLGRSH